MSLVRDYQNYYCNTWVALREGEILVPIFVENIDDSSDYSTDDFSEEHRRLLLITGRRYDMDNGRLRASRIRISVLNEDLVLESPDLGYVLVGRDVRWSMIRPIRQRLKGMASNKVQGTNIGRGTDNAKLIYDLFNPSFNGLVNRYLFVCPLDNSIHYKGVIIGRVDDTVIRLYQRFMYVFPQFTANPNYALFTAEVL